MFQNNNEFNWVVAYLKDIYTHYKDQKKWHLMNYVTVLKKNDSVEIYKKEEFKAGMSLIPEKNGKHKPDPIEYYI